MLTAMNVFTFSVPRSRRALRVAGALFLCTGAASFAAGPDALRQAAGRPGGGGADNPRPATERITAEALPASDLPSFDRRFIEQAAKSNRKEMALSHVATERAQSGEVREFAQQVMEDHHQVQQQLTRLAHNKGVVLREGGAAMRQQHMMREGRRPGPPARRGAMTGPDAGSHSAAGDVAATTGRPDPGSRSGTASEGAGGTPGERRAMMDTGEMPMMHDGREMPMRDRHMAMMDDRDARVLSQWSGEEFDQRYVRLMVREHQQGVDLFERAARDAEDPQVRSFASQHVPKLREHLQEARNLQRRVAE